MIAFRLSMPGVSSWNGRWSGEDREYVKVVDVGRGARGFVREHEIVEASPYGYDFGDGWYASVSATAIDGQEARKLRRRSAGFCGYGWMVDEILADGRIRTLDERALPPNESPA